MGLGYQAIWLQGFNAIWKTHYIFSLLPKHLYHPFLCIYKRCDHLCSKGWCMWILVLHLSLLNLCFAWKRFRPCWRHFRHPLYLHRWLHLPFVLQFIQTYLLIFLFLIITNTMDIFCVICLGFWGFGVLIHKYVNSLSDYKWPRKHSAGIRIEIWHREGCYFNHGNCKRLGIIWEKLEVMV